MLKALIGGHGERYAFTHDIEILVNHAATLGEEIPVRLDMFVALTRFAGVRRYEEPDPVSVTQRAELDLEIAKLLSFTLARLKILRPKVDWTAI